MDHPRPPAVDLRDTPPAGAVTRAGLVAAALVGVPVFLAVQLLLVNGDGPLDDHSLVGLLTAALTGLLGGTLALSATERWLARRPVAVVGGLVAYGAALLVLFPNAIDEHESFVDTPDDRQECHGWNFSHYPPQAMDASSTTYCVGVETPRPRG